MFHVRDLLAGAQPVDWAARGPDPRLAALRRLRARHNVDLPGVPPLRVGDVGLETPLGAAISAAADRHGPEGLAALATVLKDPAAVLAGPSDEDRARTYWLLGGVREPGRATARVVVGEIRARPKPRDRGSLILDARVDLYEQSEEAALRLRLEAIYLGCADALRVVRDRGRRRGPPAAVWLGHPPADRLPEGFLARLPAIGAIDGYLLRVIAIDARAPAIVEQAVRDARPELLLLWPRWIASERILELVRKAAPDAQVVELDEDVGDALDAARDWISSASVRYFEEPGDDPPDMLAAVQQAEAESKYLAFAKQAHARAKESAYKSPGEVLRGLQELDRLAGMYRERTFRGPTEKLFLDHSDLIYRDGVSKATRERHATHYSVPWDGRHPLMGPHLCFGSAWTSEGCARVYWHVDDETRTWVVGHVGRHLPGPRD